jgi:hypothetical protein
MAGPLSGLTIVELAGIGPGPMCSMMLGDMGADVIRVDRTKAHVMDRLADPKFAVQVEFKIDDIDGQARCMVVCGQTIQQQYLGLFVDEFNDFTILLSNFVFIPLPDINPQENIWYRFTMIYDTMTNNARFYMGNNLVESSMHALARANNDAFVSNYFPAAGYPIEGNWRNLRIYGAEETTALEDELSRASAFRVTPNPATQSITIGPKNIFWHAASTVA